MVIFAAWAHGPRLVTSTTHCKACAVDRVSTSPTFLQISPGAYGCDDRFVPRLVVEFVSLTLAAS